MSLETDLKKFAAGIGVDLVGIASAAPFLEEERILRLRERQGFRSEFEERDIALRCYPELLLPGVRSIISIGVRYHGPAFYEHPPPHENAVGWISSHATGKDYHAVVMEKMDQPIAFIKRYHPDAKCKAFVDTSPLLDRAVAARAGIGWFGKNCSIITKEFGSMVFLGEMLTDVDLNPDSPIDVDCGSCTKCLDACPTGALTEAYVLDSKRCLSYITQMRGYVPREFRKLLGKRLYGCDTCQDVCPYNLVLTERIERRNEEGIGPRGYISLRRLLSMTRKEFQEELGSTAAGWRGKTIIQRNGIIALGNSGDSKAIPSLVSALHDERPAIRGHAAWALGEIGTEDARIALRERLSTEKDPLVLEELRAALR